VAVFLTLGGAGFIKPNFQGVFVVCRAFHEFIAASLSNLCVCHPLGLMESNSLGVRVGYYHSKGVNLCSRYENEKS